MKGLSDAQIAKNIGISERTMSRWKKEKWQICQVLKRGKEEANYIIENKLYEAAKNGNVTAMIFFLKNNYRDKYSDSQLSVEEIALNKERTKQVKAQTRKAQAEAEIAEHKAKVLKEQGTNVENALEYFLDTLGENIKKESDDK